MVKLIAFYEDCWMPPGTDSAQYSHLARAFGCEFQMIRAWEEAVVPEGHTVVVCDETGLAESRTYAHPTDAVYVFGRSAQDVMGAVPHAISIRVDTPATISLFGISAASIILQDRFGA